MAGDAFVNEFLQRCVQDIASGGLKDLAHYQALYPDKSDVVECEYRRLHEQTLAAPRPADEAPIGGLPRHLGPYRLVREIGRGGQGMVFLAEDGQLGRRVALKILPGLWAAAPENLERFEREAAIASRLDDPGICTVFHTGREQGIVYIAMRYVEGETLAARIQQARTASRNTTQLSLPSLPEPVSGGSETPPAGLDRRPTGPGDLQALVRLVERAARALHTAHEAGIVHRDIKPGNIMVASSGRPVILDFGLARDMQGDLSRLTRSDDLFGTPAYMSPEQVAGARTLDRRTDVWSLGVTLFESLTLQRPFNAPTREALYKEVLIQEPRDPARLNRAIPRDLRAILLTALEKDRDRRYATAWDLAEDLRRYRTHEPIRARLAGPVLRLRRWVQRNPMLSLALLILVVGLSTSTYLFIERTTALGEARRERDEKTHALDEIRRLVDLSRLRALRSSARELRPATPDRVADIRDWIATAELLLRNRSEHGGRLEVLRGGALPWNPAEQARDRSVQEQRRANLVTRRETWDAVRRDALAHASSRTTAWLDWIDTEVARLDYVLGERLTWTIPGDGLTQFRHDSLDETMKLLDEVEVLLPRMRAALAHAETVVARTLDEPRELWAAILADLASPQLDSPYGRLDWQPRAGLFPLGRDPDSRLYEFALVETGKPPARDESGRLLLDAESAVVMVLLPGGTFVMGSEPPAGDADPRTRPSYLELPAHEVALDPFLISKHEVTQAQWTRLTGENPSAHQPVPEREKECIHLGHVTTASHPVESVDWHRAREVLSLVGLQLPTEAQWEYAARAGTRTPWWSGSRKSSLQGCGNLADADAAAQADPNWPHEPDLHDGRQIHAPVGTYRANPFGLHDMEGNVSEWCRDPAGSYRDDPAVPPDGFRPNLRSENRILRGGNFLDLARDARPAARDYQIEPYAHSTAGVRAVLVP